MDYAVRSAEAGRIAILKVCPSRPSASCTPCPSSAPFHYEGRQGKDHTHRFPDLVSALRILEGALILDGEMAVYDRQLISRFEWLRHHAPPDLATPPLFMVFDCPYARNKDLRRQPLYVRRNVIEDLLDEQDAPLPVRRLSDDGLKAWQQVAEHGCEGLVAKDPASPYVGGRTLKWLKVKHTHYREGERGWEPMT